MGKIGVFKNAPERLAVNPALSCEKVYIYIYISSDPIWPTLGLSAWPPAAWDPESNAALPEVRNPPWERLFGVVSKRAKDTDKQDRRSSYCNYINSRAVGRGLGCFGVLVLWCISFGWSIWSGQAAWTMRTTATMKGCGPWCHVMVFQWNCSDQESRPSLKGRTHGRTFFWRSLRFITS